MPTVELILVLKILEPLHLRLDIAKSADSQETGQAGPADLDALLDQYRQP